ncbi:class I SAM-dependent methyltransferase [Flavobacteriales bacterium]|nr:class I SAM-dependent methyltransferase [Flavobacteriales bacterium]
MSADFKNKYHFLEDENWQDFILKNYIKPLDKVILSMNKGIGVDKNILANQLNGKLEVERKVPAWKDNMKLIFPKKINIEQCSSELTARYKSQIVKGKSSIDLTGGWGVDSFFMSQSFEQSVHCEQDNELQFIANRNFINLNASIESFHSDGISYLKATKRTFDLIYVDPSRRNQSNNKVVRLDEYTPNILEHLDLLLTKGKQLLIKTSPLLDIKKAIQQLPQLTEIHVLALNNECKELVFLVGSQKTAIQPIVICKDLVKASDFTFDYQQEADYQHNLSQPLKYIYEPNVSILKAGAFKSIAAAYNLFKLHPNSHLYTSQNRVEDFPGRCFELRSIVRLNKKEILPILESKKANISKRNFPNTVNEIRKKLGLSEGGNDYVFATTLMDEKKRLLVCKKC